MRPTLVTIVLNLILAALVSTESIAQEQMRQWTSRDKSETVDATFQSYDPKTKLVVLQLQNGETLQLSLKQLSRGDQRYVTKVKRDRPEKFTPVEEERAEPTAKKRNRSNRSKSSKVVKAFGINWTPGMEAALKNATGKESPEDDRPVMWLRVLGDLNGFM